MGAPPAPQLPLPCLRPKDPASTGDGHVRDWRDAVATVLPILRNSYTQRRTERSVRIAEEKEDATTLATASLGAARWMGGVHAAPSTAAAAAAAA